MEVQSVYRPPFRHKTVTRLADQTLGQPRQGFQQLADALAARYA